MTQESIHRLLMEQFAIDYNCTPADFQRRNTLVTELVYTLETRKREEQGILSMLTYGGKLVIAAVPELLEWSRTVLARHCSVEWHPLNYECPFCRVQFRGHAAWAACPPNLYI